MGDSEMKDKQYISGDMGGDDKCMYDCQEIRQALPNDATGSTFQNNQMYMMQ